MREANCPIHPDDLPALARNHQAYLDDEDGLVTNAAKLQDDAYALGHQRAMAEHASASLLSIQAGVDARNAEIIRLRARIAAIESQQATSVGVEPAGWQFYQDGKWWSGDDRIKDHRANTEAAGYAVRNLYAALSPAGGGVNVPRKVLADFIEYSVPGPYGCDEKWFADKQALVALAHAKPQANSQEAE